MSLDSQSEFQENISEEAAENASESSVSTGGTASVNAVTVGLRSAFWTVVAIALLFSCFLMFFPYTAMRFYTKLDNKEMALYNAEKYMRFHSDELNTERGVFPSANGKYADALYCAANNSVYLLNKSIDKFGYDSADALRYARKVDVYAQNWLDCNIVDSLYERTRKIDDYNIGHSVYALHPYVYSYADYLAVAQFKAWYVMGDYARIIELVNAVTTRWGQEDWSVSELSDSELDESFLLLARLSAYLDAEFDKLGLEEVIASSPDRLVLSNNPAIANKSHLLGSSKPFDLFVYDSVDTDIFGNTHGSGEFTALYDTLENAFDSFVDYLREHSSDYVYGSVAATESITTARRNQLRLTYQLKILNDLSRSMNNLSAILNANNMYFNAQYRQALIECHDNWQSMRFVANVRTTDNGITTNGSCFINYWYEHGYLYDYLRLYATA